MRELMRRERAHSRKVGFVPTMGSLHEGHLSLVRRMREVADTVVVSIFVNPSQFNSADDYSEYPRDLTADVDLLMSEGVDYVFTPEAQELYPEGHRTIVEVEGLGEILEGKSRPGHFRGVTTVVLKLLQTIQPTIVAFGRKDYQQSIIVQRMVRDLLLDTEVSVLPIVRDEDGLALSSRNRHLSAAERETARRIPLSLVRAREIFAAGGRRPEELIVAVRECLEEESNLEVDYVEVVDAESLEPIVEIVQDAVLLVAASAGKTRLLDNEWFRV
jgi:pantoate--beta-alanine ligase